MATRPDSAPISLLLRPFLLTLAVIPPLAGCPAPRDLPEMEDGETGTDGVDAAEADAGMPMTTGDDDGDDDTSGHDDDAETGDDDAETGGDETGDGDDDDDAETGGASTGGEPSCEDMGGACAPAFPDGWDGPVVLRPWVDGEAVECDGDYDVTVAADLGYDLAADPAECVCDCGAPTGGSCDGEVSVFETGVLDGGCWPFGAAQIATMEANSVEVLNETGNGGSFGVAFEITDAPAYSGGTCEETESETLPEVAFEQHFTLCAGAGSDDPCEDDERCTPIPEAPAEAALCIWAPGDLACPSGWGYPDKTLGYEGYDDMRSCTACGCGPGTGECTDGSMNVQLLYEAMGTITALNLEPDASCVPLGPDFTVLQAAWVGVVPDEDEIGCDPIGGVPSGNVAPADPVTVCCHGL